ncbi:MAG: M48 family metallopeptidase [Spirochaetales bacterium]|nr:M48 family metallopeptidase [Spirochaetales bacterium]
MLKIERSKRKTLRLSITNNGDILVKSPHFVTKKAIEDFVLQNKNWIERSIEKVKTTEEKFNFNTKEELRFLDNTYKIHKGNSINKIFTDSNKIYIPLITDINPIVISWYKKEAKKEITELVNYYTDILNINYNKIYIKSQKSRWGSCSGLKNLNFNWKIVLTNSRLLHYLVIHEVAHLIEMNHSKAFWDIVNRLDPNHLNHRKELLNFSL